MNSEIILYQSEDGQTKVEVRMEGETVWLTQEQIAELFQRERSVITKHIGNVFEEGEWDRKAMCKFCTLLVLIVRSSFIASMLSSLLAIGLNHIAVPNSAFGPLSACANTSSRVLHWMMSG